VLDDKSGDGREFSGRLSTGDVVGVNFTPDVHAPRREANVPSVASRPLRLSPTAKSYHPQLACLLPPSALFAALECGGSTPLSRCTHQLHRSGSSGSAKNRGQRRSFSKQSSSEKSNSEDYENKEEANRRFAGVCVRKRLPHPGCFAKRGCKLLKTNDGSCKKRGKRLQEAASS
jgi:hypothetical protein